MTDAQRRSNLKVIELKPGLKFTEAALKNILPDVETALFFGKIYELDHAQLGVLLHEVFKTDLTRALFGGSAEHSHELQDYLVDIVDFMPEFTSADLIIVPDDQSKHGEILPEVWKSLEVEVASSIKAVADKLTDVINKMPGKQGAMLFGSMRVLNKKRPTIGDYRAQIKHPPMAENLVILDVSGSMSEPTVRAIAEDVVGLGYMANAHFAIVSNTCTYWEPGTYSVDEVLAAAEYGGTHYEMLLPLFDRDWGTVVTIADYDSSHSAKSVLRDAVGKIDTLLDVSLVNKPTYLAECIGQMASAVRPLLVANDHHDGSWVGHQPRVLGYDA